MEIHQLKTFVTVAREGSITRAAERLYLSQPAVSAHIKAIEETFAITLFERTVRGMSLTPDGERLLAKAEQTLAAHRDLIDEATRIKGRLSGKLRLGAGGNASSGAVGRLLRDLADRHPGIEISFRHGISAEILADIRAGGLDGGFYNEAGEPPSDLETVAVASFPVFLAAPVGFIDKSQPLDWQSLSDMPWVCPSSHTCCGLIAENLFLRHQFRPRRLVGIDREDVARTLVASGVGIGLLHGDTAIAAQAAGEVDIVCEVHKSVRVLFTVQRERSSDPLLQAVRTVLSSMGPTG